MNSNTAIQSAQEQSSPFNNQALENYIQSNMERWHVPGLSIAIVKDGKTVLCKGYGTREAGKVASVDAHTLFPIAGCTLLFTACAIAMLVSERKMNWHDRLRDLYPSFRTGNDLVTHYTTVVDALAQRTGLQNEMSLSLHPRPHLDRNRILERLQYLTAAQEFRSGSGGGKLVNVAVGEIIPALTGTSWDDFLTERLFKSIGMGDSITGPHLLRKNHNIATLHSIEGDNLIPVSYPQNSNIGPIASIYSSATDMAKWLTFQLNNGRVDDKDIVPEKEMATIRTSHMATTIKFPGIVNHFCNMGLGLLITDSNSGHKIFSYGGGVDGNEAYHAFIPELDLGIAIMANANVSLPQTLTPWIIDRYTHAPYRDWVHEGLSTSSEELVANTSPLEKIKAPADSLTPPRYSLETYTGLYHNPVLGDMSVLINDGRLSFSLDKVYQGFLEHDNYDTFFPEVTSPHTGKLVLTGLVQFHPNEMGNVVSLFMAGKIFKRSDSSGQ